MAELLERLRTALAESYHIDRALGQGGMGTVFLAQDLKHHRAVALKVLDPGLAVPLGPSRFLREVEIAGRLQHPHILTMLESGVADGMLYYVMPYVEGESLRERLDRDHQLPLDVALTLAREVAEALDTAHRHGVVHRDIKPENILLSEGSAMVADFGIARAIWGATGKTTPTGTMVGTPRYMSPEQAAGSIEVDGRSDIYSLGCVLYEMLAGQPPFVGPPESVVHQHLSLDPHPVTALRPAVPESVSLVLARSLAKTPADRFPTAARFSEALAQAGSVPVAGPRPGAKPRRRRAVAIAVGVVLAGMAVVAGVRWMSVARASPGSLVVLPFANDAGEPELDYLCEGIAAEILADLVQTKRLNVVSRASAWGFRGSRMDATAIARELGARSVLQGTVRKFGQILRLDVQLIDGRSGSVVWSGQIERAMDDVRHLADEIGEQVASKLGSPAVGAAAEPALPRTTSPVAYDHYLQAGRYLDLSGDPHGPDQAAALYTKAIAIDSGFALAYAGLSKALYKTYSRTKEPEVFQRANEASERAMRLSPHVLEARLARAQAYRMAGRNTESIAELVAILEVNPNWDEAHVQLGASYREAGDLERAEESFRRALSLRPGYWRNWNSLGSLLVRKGEYPGARAAFEQVVKLDPPGRSLGHQQLVALDILEGKYGQAVAAYERFPYPVEDGTLASNIGTAYFFVGRLDKAEKLYLLAVRFEPQNAKWRQNLGDLYARQGRAILARSEYRHALRLVEGELALRPEDLALGVRRVLLLAKAGDCGRAIPDLEALRPGLPTDDAQMVYSLARAQALCGRRAEALDALRKAIAMGVSAKLVREQDEFHSLAQDPEFVRLTTASLERR